MNYHSIMPIQSNLDTESNYYKVDDLMVGDYIQNFGNYNYGLNTWRVVDKTSDGVLIIMDRVFTRAFDAPRPLGDPSRLPYNSILSTTGSATIEGSREQFGSNFWYESDLKYYLNGEFFDQFSEGEQNAIATVKQTQTIWRGDTESSFVPPSALSLGTVSVATDASVTGTVQQHVNRMDSLGSDFNPGDKSISMGTSIHDHSASYKKLQTYNIYDKVFIQDLMQAEAISRLPLKNVNGLPYARGVDAQGNPIPTWTRSPFMDHDVNKNGQFGDALVIASLDSAELSGIFMGTGAASDDRGGVLPMMYLDNRVSFKAVGEFKANPGESVVNRPSSIDGQNTGWVSFEVVDTVSVTFVVNGDVYYKINVPWGSSLTRIHQILFELGLDFGSFEFDDTQDDYAVIVEQPNNGGMLDRLIVDFIQLGNSFKNLGLIFLIVYLLIDLNKGGVRHEF
ncbi:MAG: DUF6273 domain-containing protein [Clostridiales bacterium]|nr:DUF6273 domain-containing protein [Clostridiales bacterium]